MGTKYGHKVHSFEILKDNMTYHQSLKNVCSDEIKTKKEFGKSHEILVLIAYVLQNKRPH